MAYTHLEALREKYKNSPHLSVRGIARQLGVSHSALSKIVRGHTYNVSEHMDSVLTRWLYPEREIPACTCRRCQGQESGLQEHVEALEANVVSMLDRHEAIIGEIERLRERVEALESIFYASSRSLSPFVSGV